MLMTGTITLGRRTLGLLVLAAFLVGGLFASLALGIGQAQDDGSGWEGGILANSRADRAA